MTIVASEPTIPVGMKRWLGGDSAPADWDGGRVWLRENCLSAHNVLHNFRWSHLSREDDIIAYTPSAPGTPGEAREGQASEATTEAAYRAVYGPDMDPLQHPEGWDHAAAIATAVQAALRPSTRDAQCERMAIRDEIINTPETADFMAGVPLEAAHQRERWSVDHDAGKTPFDWFWLIGYLAQKAASAQVAGDTEKAKHHTISTAAALANWHAQLAGRTAMRPGIGPDNGGQKPGSAHRIATALSADRSDHDEALRQRQAEVVEAVSNTEREIARGVRPAGARFQLSRTADRSDLGEQNK